MTFLFLAVPLLLRCQRPLPAALVVYFDLFLAQVHLDGLLVLHDPLAQPDLLLEHDAFGDHDLLLEDLQDHLVLADVLLGGTAGLPGLPHCRHPLDVYLLAPLRDSHHLALGVCTLFLTFTRPASRSRMPARTSSSERATLGFSWGPSGAMSSRPLEAKMDLSGLKASAANKKSKGDTPRKRTCLPKKVCPYSPVPRSVVASSISTSSRLTSSS